jgi:hypothetical protein
VTDAAAPQVSRGLLIALGVVGGIGALFVLYTFVLSPLLTTEDLATPPDDVIGTPTEDPVAEDPLDDPAEDISPLPETFEVFTARDPFMQLVVAPVTADPADPTDPTTPPGTTPPGTTPPGTTPPGTTPPGTTPPPPGTTPPGTTPPGTTPPGTQPSPAPPGTTVGVTTVRLVDVSTGPDGQPQISVTVNGQGFEVGVGDTFRDNFRVLDISGSCTTLLFGDSRFTLCTGEEIRK